MYRCIYIPFEFSKVTTGCSESKTVATHYLIEFYWVLDVPHPKLLYIMSTIILGCCLLIFHANNLATKQLYPAISKGFEKNKLNFLIGVHYVVATVTCCLLFFATILTNKLAVEVYTMF